MVWLLMKGKIRREGEMENGKRPCDNDGEFHIDDEPSVNQEGRPE